jgi:DNA transformation protein and related proteins
MSVTPSYRQFVVDCLGRVRHGIRAKHMFGGVGLYADEHFFALIAGDTLYLKVDEGNRADFEARGMGPFRPFGETGEVMQYYELPAELLEEPEALREWVEQAIQVARRAKQPAKKRTR